MVLANMPPAYLALDDYLRNAFGISIDDVITEIYDVAVDIIRNNQHDEYVIDRISEISDDLADYIIESDSTCNLSRDDFFGLSTHINIHLEAGFPELLKIVKYSDIDNGIARYYGYELKNMMVIKELEWTD